MLECRVRHFDQEAEANRHIEQHHSGRGSACFCACGKGYRITLEGERRYYLSRRSVAPEQDPEMQRSCFATVRYPTEHAAKQVVRKRGFVARVAPCTVCGGYHICKMKERHGY